MESEPQPFSGFVHLIGHTVLRGEIDMKEALDRYQDAEERRLGERPMPGQQKLFED